MERVDLLDGREDELDLLDGREVLLAKVLVLTRDEDDARGRGEGEVSAPVLGGAKKKRKKRGARVPTAAHQELGREAQGLARRPVRERHSKDQGPSVGARARDRRSTQVEGASDAPERDEKVPDSRSTSQRLLAGPMLQLKLAAGAAVAAMVGWSAFVYRERSNIPLGRRRKFSPGSAGTTMTIDDEDESPARPRPRHPRSHPVVHSSRATDDLLVNRVRTGDLVLFSRDCGLYLPAGASLCAATKRVGGTEYDHAGVVVFHRGEPYIAEDTFTETKVRLGRERARVGTKETGNEDSREHRDLAPQQLRPFDERVICSRASEILIRPLKVPVRQERA